MKIIRTITIAIEADTTAINAHEQVGELERLFLQEQLTAPVIAALENFHGSKISEANVCAELVLM